MKIIYDALKVMKFKNSISIHNYILAKFWHTVLHLFPYIYYKNYFFMSFIKQKLIITLLMELIFNQRIIFQKM